MSVLKNIEKKLLEDKLKLVVNRIKDIKNDSITEKCKIGIIDIDNWEWAQGVGLNGLFNYYLDSQDDSELQWIINWIDKNIQKGLPERNVNTTAPLYMVASVAQITGNKMYMKICHDWAKWIMDELPRTKYGGFQHAVSDGPNDAQLWVDTLFMTVLFLAKMGVIENNKRYLDECEHQFLLHANYLMDRNTGLWYHGWTFEEYNNFSAALWGRGNCWITAFIPEYIELTNINCGSKQFMIDILNAQLEALSKYQDANGMWHTLINDKTSYLETSATAGFGYGILKAIRLGIISDKYYDMAIKAVKGVIENIDSNGTVLNVSYGTAIGKTLQHYKDIPLCAMTYGQALAIMLLVEYMKHIK